VIEPPDPRTIAELVADHRVELVVVGLPVSLSGEEGPQATQARAFRAALAANLDVPVEIYDERLTTRLAESSARAGAGSPTDALAAAHLLESYLEARAALGADPAEEGE
jgi:putative Holliday junction resolvase